MKKIFIFGAGLSGSVAARFLAEKGYSVSIFERKDKVSGNLYDYKDRNGIFVQEYGPHSFHTNNEDVFQFISKYTQFIPSVLKVGAYLNDYQSPCPFNYSTIDNLYSKEFALKLKEDLRNEFNNEFVPIISLLNSSNKKIRDYANYLFENDYRPYTSKQWGIDPKDISVEIISRVPVRLSYADRYFDDKYQLQPKDGYYSLICNLLDHKNISVQTNSDISLKIRNNKMYINEENLNKDIFVIYTGAIDELFDYSLGYLPYRSLRFVFEEVNVESYQDRAVIAYPKDPNITRITEFKKLYDNYYHNISCTVIAKEYPESFNLGKNDRYYPILTDNSKNMYESYFRLTRSFSNFLLIGRLANFKYFNMDQAVLNSLNSIRAINL